MTSTDDTDHPTLIRRGFSLEYATLGWNGCSPSRRCDLSPSCQYATCTYIDR
ncbi:hypothetical protein [Streptomyces brasiliensis]|uniref:hypothetical protein n=1 Tax=Streptomyces brasiliensis TaxID=1954 RepID=UPI001670FD58|nr:hypothetical protein [Streptomyces brasiliensis]